MTKSFKEWKEDLLPTEIEALEDYGFADCDLISAKTVMATIIQWNGGIASAYEVVSIVSRVYGIELD